MSLKLPLQSKAIRPKFQSKKVIFGDDDDDEEHVQDELVVGFEDNKLKEAKPKEKKKLLSINPLPNADWRKLAKQKKELYIPAQALQQDQPGQIEEEKVVTYGLTIQKKTENDGIQETITEEEIIQEIQEDNKVEEEEVVIVEEKPKTLEERAVEAIIKDSMGENDDSEEGGGPKRVIHVDETLAFRDDVKNRPDETTMEDYENIPVEEFGAALLRGLGWNEGEGIGRNRKAGPAPSAQPVKQRDALLGLGAKPEDVSKEKKFQHKRAAYTFKDTSLFKKIAKKKLNDDDGDSEKEYRSSSSRASSRASSRESSRSSRHDDDRNSRSGDRYDSKDRHDRYSRSDRDRKRSRSRSSDRHRTNSSSSSSRSHRRRSRSRSPDRYSSSSSSKRRK